MLQKPYLITRRLQYVTSKIYNIELPKWFNDSRTVEQMLVRIVLAVVSYNCVLQ